MIVPKYVVDENIINNEIKELNNVLTQQRQLKKTLLLYLEKISEGIYNSLNPKDTNQIHTFLENIQRCFDRLKENISKIIELKEYLDSISKTNQYEDLDFLNYNNRCSELMEKINYDNSTYYSFMDSLFAYINVTFPEITVDNNIEQKKMSELYKSQITIDELFNEDQESNNEQEAVVSEDTTSTEENKEEVQSQDVTEESNDSEERVLFISYKENYAILPYSTQDLERYFSDNPEKYSSLQDIIDKEYTISLENYTSSIYDECISVAKKSPDYNTLKAIKFANNAKRIENANPLVIKACRNLDEVEKYLDCLENNTLDSFDLFKIIEEK